LAIAAVRRTWRSFKDDRGDTYLGSDQEASDPAGERSEGFIVKRKRRVTSSVRRRFSKK
jgi:hypothetical protein